MDLKLCESPAPSAQEEVLVTAGALLISPSRHNKFHDYEVVMLNNMDLLLNDREHSAFGSTVDDIEVELNRMHPSPHEKCSMITKWVTGARGYDSNKTRFKLYDRPVYLRDEVEREDHDEVLTDIISITASVGPILVSKGIIESLSGARYGGVDNVRSWATRENIVVQGLDGPQDPHGHYYQVNYNPAAISRRSKTVATLANKKRLVDDFSNKDLHGLIQVITPSDWPRNHPFSGVVRGPKTNQESGWGRRKDIYDHGTSIVIGLIDLTEKLAPRSFWWRTHRPNVFRKEVECLLQFVHHIERTNKARIKDIKVEREEYATQHECQPPDWGCYSMSDENDRLRLCRWLRREAKAMDIEMPAPPVYPKPKRKKIKTSN